MKIAGKKIEGITSNSKNVKKGFVFVAIKGSRQDGTRFINEAVSNGASLVVVEDKKDTLNVPREAKVLQTKNCRKFLAREVNKFYGFPSGKIKVIGITGTNGKTTISYLIEAICKSAGRPCGVIGTINYHFKEKLITAKNTTPGPEESQKLLSQMYEWGARYCAMEVSSHALTQERVSGINFSSAIFTNLTQDHLDYHKNMEDYFIAKSGLFLSLGPRRAAIINNDDKYGRRLAKSRRNRIITYGIDNPSTVTAKDIHYGIDKSEFTLVAPGANLRLKTSLVGKFNIYNILAAVAWAISEKINIKDIKSGIEKFKNVRGRLERVFSKKGFDIFIDYAHTPDALTNVIGSLKPLVEGKIRVVFGCGGERDRSKRPKMGRIASDLADFAVITSDNPRSENPAVIIKEICSGIKKDNYCIVPQRLQAIKRAISMLKKGDCLLVAGKGHENYQILKNETIHFSDREAVEKCLKSGK